MVHAYSSDNRILVPGGLRGRVIAESGLGGRFSEKTGHSYFVTSCLTAIK